MKPATTKWLFGVLVLSAVAGSFFVARTEAPRTKIDQPEKRPTLPEGVPADLDDPDYAVRFERAMELAGSEQEGLDARLAEALEATPPTHRAHQALEFVLWKRSRKPFPKREDSRDERPNILLISIDTLRADHLGCYDYARQTSPHIDSLARRGVVFENAFSTASWTLPGHMSMLTSLYPSFHKLVARRNGTRLDEGELTLAEQLRDLGYRTAALVNHPFLAAQWGFDQGFDLYLRQETIVRAERQTQSAIDWIEWHLFHQYRGTDPSAFFLFLHYMDPHETYDAPPPFGDRYTGPYEGTLKPSDHFVTIFKQKSFPSREDYQYVLDLYDGEISYVDQAVGRLWERLDELGLLDSMLIVLTSDHGEEFKEHGGMGHKSTIYREQLQVPLIITYPRKIAPGQRVVSQASLVDIYPTVMGLIDEGVPPRAQGRDLGASLTGATPTQSDQPESRATARPPIFAELGPASGSWEGPTPLRAVRTDRYKLVVDLSGEDIELYDVRRDPGEQHDLSRTRRGSQIAGELRQQVTTFMEAAADYNHDARGKDVVRVDDKTQRQLRALGYLD